MRPLVIVTRDPDFSNEYATFDGDVEWYDIDAGYADLRDPEEFAEWRNSHLASAKSFREEGREEAAQYIENTVATYEDAHGHTAREESD